MTTVCMVCMAVLVDAGPGATVSHGIGRCCWDAWRNANGLRHKPYPTQEKR